MSNTYRRGQKKLSIDPNAFHTYQAGVALRIQRKTKGRIRGKDAWELAAPWAAVLWVLRGPISFFKKLKVDRALKRKLKSNSESVTDK